MNKEDTIRRAFKSVTGFDDYNKFNIELILGDEKNQLPNGFEDNTLYGFNVRLQTKDPVTPILGGKKKDKKLRKKSVQDIFNAIEPEMTILKVFENCSDREIEFSYTGGEDVKVGDVKLTLKDEEKTSSIIDKLKQKGSFLDIHKKEMFPNSRTMYYWISRENEETNDGNETQPAFLSNILIISSEETNIGFVKKHKIHFLRFLLKLQAAYSLILSEKVETTAVRASIAQVMARNMSHNFGSHVLSNLIGDDVYDKLRDVSVKKDLENFERYTSISEWDNDVFKNDGKNRQLPFFFQYLKSRMDYLSEVTFGVSNLLTTKMMRNDVMKELDQVRILLNYISGVSDFKYSFKLQLPDYDIGVAFPSDVLGCQAFYNIIENIIRNTAKHAKNKDGKKVTFTITIKDNFAKEAGCEDIEGVDELYCVEIDNGVTEDHIDELVNGKKEIDLETGEEIITKRGQNTRLDESVLQGQSLRSHSLGLLEMEASAAFLRQIDLPEIESDNYTVDLNDKYYHVDSKGKKRLNILKAFAIKENEENAKGRLGYRFFLQKPKEFLFVGDWKICEQDTVTAAPKQQKSEPEEAENMKLKAIRRNLLNCGIQFIKADEFCKSMEAEKAFAHQFLIYQEGISEDIEQYWNNDCKTLLPLRRLFISEDEWKTISQEWFKLVQQDDKQNKSGDQDKKLNGKDILLQLKKWAWGKYIGNADDIIICSHAYDIYEEAQKQQIVFLDHGENYEAERKKRDKIKNMGGNAWIENLSSRTWGKLPGFIDLGKTGGRDTQLKNYISNIEDIAEIKAEIFEAYHYRIIVLDERIQKFSNENSEGSSKDTAVKIPCYKLFETTDVLIPDTPLDPNSFLKESVDELKRFVASNITTDAFVLVHYGVLERMCGGNVDEINKFLNEWAGKEKVKRVVVTSGRGSHTLDLPKSVCFVNLSSVLYAFNENRNKYLINNLLNQSRRKRNE